MNCLLDEWLKYNIVIKLFILGGLDIFGLATFLFLVTTMHIINISEVICLLKHKRRNNAKEKNLSINALVTEIDINRNENNNLSSAIRIFILEDLKQQLKRPS